MSTRREKAQQEVANLSDVDKMTVMKHLGYRCEIQKIINIREHLIESFHKKKAVMKRVKYRFVDTAANWYYSKILFLGKTANTSLQVLPSSFHHRLEDVMYGELQNRKWDFLSVYYSSKDDFFPDVFKQQTSFDADHWKIDQGAHMSDNDTALLKEYRDLICNLFETNIERIGSRRCPEIIKEYKRIKRVFTRGE